MLTTAHRFLFIGSVSRLCVSRLTDRLDSITPLSNFPKYRSRACFTSVIVPKVIEWFARLQNKMLNGANLLLLPTLNSLHALQISTSGIDSKNLHLGPGHTSFGLTQVRHILRPPPRIFHLFSVGVVKKILHADISCLWSPTGHGNRVPGINHGVLTTSVAYTAGSAGLGHGGGCDRNSKSSSS